jgi:hypothetical protein
MNNNNNLNNKGNVLDNSGDVVGKIIYTNSGPVIRFQNNKVLRTSGYKVSLSPLKIKQFGAPHLEIKMNYFEDKTFIKWINNESHAQVANLVLNSKTNKAIEIDVSPEFYRED